MPSVTFSYLRSVPFFGRKNCYIFFYFLNDCKQNIYIYYVELFEENFLYKPITESELLLYCTCVVSAT